MKPIALSCYRRHKPIIVVALSVYVQCVEVCALNKYTCGLMQPGVRVCVFIWVGSVEARGETAMNAGGGGGWTRTWQGAVVCAFDVRNSLLYHYMRVLPEARSLLLRRVYLRFEEALRLVRCVLRRRARWDPRNPHVVILPAGCSLSTALGGNCEALHFEDLAALLPRYHMKTAREWRRRRRGFLRRGLLRPRLDAFLTEEQRRAAQAPRPDAPLGSGPDENVDPVYGVTSLVAHTTEYRARPELLGLLRRGLRPCNAPFPFCRRHLDVLSLGHWRLLLRAYVRQERLDRPFGMVVCDAALERALQVAAYHADRQEAQLTLQCLDPQRMLLQMEASASPLPLALRTPLNPRMLPVYNEAVFPIDDDDDDDDR